MQLPYVREVNYLSPSALRLLEEHPVEFYFRRLGPSEGAPARPQQSYPAAVGIAFDAHVKVAVAESQQLRCPTREFLLAEVKEQRDRALALGAELLHGYRRSGAMARFLEDGPTAVQGDWEDFVPGTRVPVRARLDAETRYLSKPTPHDWKVVGANRPGQCSPTPGYVQCWDTNFPGAPSGPHARWGEPLERIDPDWAAQLACYGWAMGLPLADMQVSLDEVVVGEGTRVRVACHRTTVTREFQVALVARYADAWRRIQERRVVPEEMLGLSAEELRVMM